MRIHPATRTSNQPRGSGDLRRRLLRHHVPLALASGVVLLLFMTLPRFDASKYTQGNIFTGTFPQRDFPASKIGSAQLGGGRPPEEQGGGHQAPQHGGGGQLPQQEGGGHQPPQQHGGGQPSGPTPTSEEIENRSDMRRLTTATGYVALALLALTLLIGPANLLLRRRNPVSSYLRRDVGAWAAILSVVHLIPGLKVHGTGQLLDFLDYFTAPDGSLLSNSFGLGNWTGLAGLVIVVGLLALSSDLALRKLKAKNWKRIQRLNYALLALVIAHSFFYGAVLRTNSPYTLLLLLAVIPVVGGQAVGVCLWRRRYARRGATPA
jgi:methionine sulfoxide reductase heme-binding subunit